MVGIPGHGCLGLIDALKNYEDRLPILQVRHEQSAVHLADAYYRVTGTPLAVFTSIGPGAMNTVIGVASCYVDSIPVLVFTGNGGPMSRNSPLRTTPRLPSPASSPNCAPSWIGMPSS